MGHCEVVASAWLYGSDRILNNLEEMNNGRKIHPALKLYWKVCWTYVTPSILIVLTVMALSVGRHGALHLDSARF